MISKQYPDADVVVPIGTDREMDYLEEASSSSRRSKASDANRIFLEKYRQLDLVGRFEQSFPSFSDASIAKEYRNWNQQSVAVATCLLALVLVDFPYNVTRFNLAYVGTYEHPFTISSQVVAIPTFSLFGMYVFVHFYLAYYGRNRKPSLSTEDITVRRTRWCEAFLNYPVEDVIVVCSTWVLSAIFLGRVSIGACPDNVSIWNAQRCNPVANSKSFPQDDVIGMYVLPVFFQLLLRGTSLCGVFMSYAIAFAAVLYAMVTVDGYLQCYSIQNLLMFPIMSIELERWMRVAFVRHKLVVDSRQTAIAAAENEAKQVVFSAHAAQTAAENTAKILDLNNKAHLASKEQEMLRYIMGNVAHDMKTPLHSIFAELEGVRDAIDTACNDAAMPGADASLVLRTMKTTTDSTLDVVDSMTQFLVMSINRSQDYAKLTSNIALNPTLETVAVPEVLQFVTKCMAHQNCHRIIVVHPLETICSSIITDRHFLKDNLLCLVSNAVKYSDRGATIDVRLSLATASRVHGDPTVMVTVEDTGIGISDENKDVLFKPFKQAQRSAGGTGLGLFALAGRVKALGGTCGVRDREDGKQGSVFWFTFPYRPDEMGSAADDGGMARLASPRVTGAQPHHLPPLRILLTDDSVSILKVTRRFLQKHGHTVETAENGNRSLEILKARSSEFDLLITDLQMPVMDGFECVTRYREYEQQQPPGARRLFIAGMSAKADEETKSDVFAVGIDAFVPKPFDYMTLVGELRRSAAFAETLQRCLK